MTFTNCSQDYFEIQDGNKKYKLCGELPSGSKKFIFFPPGSNKLVFKFRSTFHQKKGFLIEVKQLPFSCAENMIGNNNVGAMRSRQACSRNFSGRISRITYPDYTEDNVPVEKCTYTIRKSGAGACLVQLDLSSFDFVQTPGCSTNYLLLPNGQKLCGVLGGSRKFIPFPPGKDSMALELSSTSSTSNSFDIQVTQLPGPCEEPFGSLTVVSEMNPRQCDQTIRKVTEILKSPGYPGFFGPNYECVYEIYRPDVSVCQLELEFVEFSLGKHTPPGCSSGAYLELPGKNRLCHDLTGKMIIKVSEFQDPVNFIFRSDSQTSGRGFYIIMRQVPNTCPGFTAHSVIPKAMKRCYQESSTYLGYFVPPQETNWCEFVIHRADPTVCAIRLQISSKTFLAVPCATNYIQLPDGNKMCISVTELREIELPMQKEYITLIYYGLHNPKFTLLVDQVRNSCKVQRSQQYSSKHRRWTWKVIPR
ncbi:Cubilin, partial [Stegodyphus mimosarum]